MIGSVCLRAGIININLYNRKIIFYSPYTYILYTDINTTHSEKKE